MFLDMVLAILALLTGIGVFLSGIGMLSASLRKTSTHKMHAMFKKIGNNRFQGVALGTGVTAVIQSSTAVTVMTVGLVNAGILSLFQATAIIMGANIGTTLTNLIVGLSFLPIRPLFMSLVFFGIVLKMITKKERGKVIANVLISVGILFIGLSLMSSVFDKSEGGPIPDFFTSLFKRVEFPLLLVLLGALFTIIIQSSTASMAIYMSMVAGGIMNFQTGMFLILGTEMGTCFTAMLSSLEGNRAAKRAALTHLLYNVFGTVLFLAIVWPLAGTIVSLYSAIIPSPVWQMAFFPLINNVISVAILIWFIVPFNRLVCWMIKDKHDPEESVINNFTNPRLLETPPFALTQTIKGINYMGLRAKENLETAFSAVINDDVSQKDAIEKKEATINSLAQSLSDYLVKISSAFISSHNQKMAAALHHVLSDMERIGDQAVIMLSTATKKMESGIKFSPAASEELTKMFSKVTNLFETGLESDISNNYHKAKLKSAKLKEEIDGIKDEIADTHIKRLREGVCTSGAAEYYYAVITSLKSVADHLMTIDKTVSRLGKSMPVTKTSNINQNAQQLSFSDIK